MHDPTLDESCANCGAVGNHYHADRDGREMCRDCKYSYCGHCGTHGTASERYSFGVYAGIYCGKCWKKSGYRDATDSRARFDPADAGEQMDPEPGVW